MDSVSVRWTGMDAKWTGRGTDRDLLGAFDAVRRMFKRDRQEYEIQK